MVHCVASVILEEICSEMKLARWYSLIIDETADISKTEQVSFVLRYALDGEVYGTFLSFENVSSTTGESLFLLVKKTLEENDMLVLTVQQICKVSTRG